MRQSKLGAERHAARARERRNAKLCPHLVDGSILLREHVKLVGQVDPARGAATTRLEHERNVEQSLIALRDGGDPHADVELEDAEEEKQKAVPAGETGLKGGLLDLAEVVIERPAEKYPARIARARDKPLQSPRLPRRGTAAQS